MLPRCEGGDCPRRSSFLIAEFAVRVCEVLLRGCGPTKRTRFRVDWSVLRRLSKRRPVQQTRLCSGALQGACVDDSVNDAVVASEGVLGVDPVCVSDVFGEGKVGTGVPVYRVTDSCWIDGVRVESDAQRGNELR